MASARSDSDQVFKLGWLLSDDSARARGLGVMREWVKANHEFCSEADTRPIVEAVLRGLGWDTLFDGVAREGDCRLGDFHLYLDGKICALIEVERPNRGDALPSPPASFPRQLRKPLRQLANYLKKLLNPDCVDETQQVRDWIRDHQYRRGNVAVAYAVLTTGQKWWVYRTAEELGKNEAAAYVDFCAADADWACFAGLLGEHAIREFLTGNRLDGPVPEASRRS